MVSIYIGVKVRIILYVDKVVLVLDFETNSKRTRLHYFKCNKIFS